MRHVLATLLTLLLSTVLALAEPIRVACMGDSITAGAKVNAVTESYPAQMQKLLGAGYEVKNFGKGGATMWHGGKPNAFEQLAPTKAFRPHLIIINFGINDTRSRDVDYWSHFPEFEPDARKLIADLLTLEPAPKILLCLPTTNYADLPGMPEARKQNVAERLPRLVEVRKTLRTLATTLAKEGKPLTLIDLETPTQNKPDLMDPDGVHLSVKGYGVLAEIIASQVASSRTISR